MTALQLAVPRLCLVALVGVSGSGKSTFAATHFAPFEVLSSDFCRGLVSGDENDQAASADAFDVLYYIAAKRLAAGHLTVVDATNVQPDARRKLVALARAHDVLPVAIVLDVPEKVCVDRNSRRADRDFGAPVVRRQHDQLRRSLRGLAREGFRKVHVLRGVAEVQAATIVREPLRNDFRHETGPFDVIGDVHGCRSELESLLGRLGYALVRDDAGRAVDAAHPEGRRAVFVGDLVDRGPDAPGVLRLVMGMVAAGHAFAVPGNHENKLVRALSGRSVQVTHGLAETLEQLAAEPEEFRRQVEVFCRDLVSHLVLDDGRLVVAHAGLKEAYHGRASGRVRSFALYGETTGETDEFGLPVRYPWADDYRGRAMVLYGHTPVPEPRWVNNTLCLDTGCVFGGRLTALRYPEKQLVAVPAERVWYEPARPFPPAVPPGTSTAVTPTWPGPTDAGPAASGSAGPGSADGVTGGAREPDLLDITDVLGRRVVETRHHGRVTVREDQAAGALEVMSRFAIDPRWLCYLPPTMAPCATSTRTDLLEHPAEAFDAYRSDGVGQVVCEEKHMGSRAVVLVCRDEATARTRFGADDGTTGAVHTRTGRSFFRPEVTEQLLDRLRGALNAAGLWADLDTDWLLLDAELLPWSAKAEDLLRNQYAAVGAAARSALPAALDALDAARAAGLDVGELHDRTAARAGNAEAFTAAYRRYCWPTDGLAGVRLAPFQLLASRGATYHDRDHGWHLALADRLADAAPDLVQATRRVLVDTGDAASTAAGTAWWEELTAAGGEGMVVKPYANLTRGRRGLLQPGVKVRGREYLRIVYGPDYTEPANLDRLRQRGLGHKRSLALREYALGLEALERVARGEPRWRVHEAVFAVLALESEPVDPRL
ncbi:polynucleotide kinase-phosphatase [Micromonospora cathayae]|uniref:Polynucleotide kinase-phosphatase n=1 Tax=Micromonospora cathayae TaxID=3028804 RepID=A0ABY7ZMJ4_9ACTN|nr:polynucleotide kinase-phosphatase [Micromonospora sp. HUAS 3]WDZ83651.1 polynucleotide kinase-phosphatase [Micromonospora sp. HUAS 3]